MGIQVEFNPDLALRKFGTEGRRKEECLPEKLVAGRVYDFIKKGQRNYWLEGEIPLVETNGNQVLSRPLASIRIIKAEHYLENDRPYTRGYYQINEVFNMDDDTIQFEGFQRRRK